MYASAINMNTAHRKSRYQRVTMLFVLIFLALQLISARTHTHVYTENGPDCAACAVAHFPGGGVPPATVALEPSAPQTSLPVLLPAALVRSAQTGYLTPPSHAPPGVAVVSF